MENKDVHIEDSKTLDKSKVDGETEDELRSEIETRANSEHVNDPFDHLNRTEKGHDEILVEVAKEKTDFEDKDSHFDDVDGSKTPGVKPADKMMTKDADEMLKSIMLTTALSLRKMK